MSSTSGAADTGASTGSQSAGAAAQTGQQSAGATQSQSTPGQSTPPAGASASDWTSGLNDDLKGFVQNKGFKDPASVIDSYRNLEKLTGLPKEKILRLPDNMDDPAAMNEIYSRLGKPATADEYKIKAGEGENAEFAKWMSDTFFENGLTTKQAQGILNKWNEMQGNLTKQQSEKLEAALAQQEQELKKEWGMAYDQKVQTAKRAAQAFGVAPEVIDRLEKAMGYTGVMKFFDAIGSKIGEAQYVGSNSSQGFNMTPEAARNKIAMLRGDASFIQRLQNKDVAALNEWNQAHKMAYPET